MESAYLKYDHLVFCCVALFYLIELGNLTERSPLFGSYGRELPRIT